MNFLQLAQRVFIEGGISGQINTVQNQTGEALRVVTWVAEAYREILNSDQFTFGFIRREHQFLLAPGKGTYTKQEMNLPELAQWDTSSMRVAANQDGSDESFVFNMRWPEFRNYWHFSSRKITTGRPLNCSVDQDTNLNIGPLPDTLYWLNFQYITQPPDLVADDDIPVIPNRWQMAIVWRALRHYGMFEAAPEVVLRAESAYNEIVLRMTLDQSPEIVVGPPLC